MTTAIRPTTLSEIAQNLRAAATVGGHKDDKNRHGTSILAELLGMEHSHLKDCISQDAPLPDTAASRLRTLGYGYVIAGPTHSATA